jgi:hypothetical protein
MTEHTVACRWARSVRSYDSELATTLWDVPVSPTKLRRGPPPTRTSTLSDTSPGWGDTVTGTVEPPPWVSTAGATGPTGPV